MALIQTHVRPAAIHCHRLHTQACTERTPSLENSLRIKTNPTRPWGVRNTTVTPKIDHQTRHWWQQRQRHNGRRADGSRSRWRRSGGVTPTYRYRHRFRPPRSRRRRGGASSAGSPWRISRARAARSEHSSRIHGWPRGTRLLGRGSSPESWTFHIHIFTYSHIHIHTYTFTPWQLAES